MILGYEYATTNFKLVLQTTILFHCLEVSFSTIFLSAKEFARIYYINKYYDRQGDIKININNINIKERDIITVKITHLSECE